MACLAHASVSLDLTSFEREVLARIHLRLQRSAIAPQVIEVLRVCEVTCFDDLFLAIACELETPRAWARLVEVYARRVDGLARSIGHDVRGGSVGRDLLADLASPPGSGRTRTRIGTYDGSGSLFAWLAVILRRGGATRARRKTPTPDSVEPSALDARRAASDSDTFAALVDAEEGERIVHALQAAWSTLSPREQLALHFKFGEALRLKEIGLLLGLSESGTSRLVTGALEQMRRRAKPLLADSEIPQGRLQLWAGLWRVLDQADTHTAVRDEDVIRQSGDSR